MPKFDTPVTANSDSLEKVLATSLPQLLLLYNANNLNGLFEDAFKRLAKSEAGNLLLVKVDITENPAVALAYNPSEGTPLLIALKDGEEVARQTHPTPNTLADYADYLLGKSPSLQAQTSPVKGVLTKPIHITDETFAEVVLNSDKPVLVDFWATWCPPCLMIAPTLEKMAGDLAGQLVIAKLDVDQNPMTAMEFGIQGIPALLIFKDGALVDQTAGAMPEPYLRRFVQPYL